MTAPIPQDDPPGMTVERLREAASWLRRSGQSGHVWSLAGDLDIWASAIARRASGDRPVEPERPRYCHEEVWSPGGYSSSLCMKPVGACDHGQPEADVTRTKPEWRGWPGYFGRALGAWTNADEPEERDRLRKALWAVYDEWVDAGRPEWDPAAGAAGVQPVPPEPEQPGGAL